MNDIDRVFKNAVTILRGKGDWLPNPIPQYLHWAYLDEKLEITAYADIRTQEIEAVYIDLMLSDEGGSTHISDKPFALGRRNKQGVWVFYWEENHLKYFRPGRWIAYLQRVADDIDAQARRLRNLDTQPVNDQALFPDIEG